ncbi:hypothetical protein [Streptomyces daliensis]
MSFRKITPAKPAHKRPAHRDEKPGKKQQRKQPRRRPVGRR